MARWGFLAAVAAVLFVAVPASASHHPPNAASGLVSMTVSRAENDDLLFNYTVTQQQCPNPHCDVNFGKPYGIQIYVDSGGQVGVVGPSTVVSAPANCTGGSQPLVSCDAPGRSQTDPAAALPVSATMRVHARTHKASTAEIDAQGYSLNTFQEGISVPPPNCTGARTDLEDAKLDYARAQGHWAQAMKELRRVGDTFSGVLGVFYDAATGPGPLAVPLAFLKKAIQVEQARNTLRDRIQDVAETRIRLNDARRALDDCLGLRLEGAAHFRAGSAAAADCPDEELARLIARGQALELANPVPAARRIVAAIKAHKRTQAKRAIKKLRATVAADLKRLKSLQAAVKACR